jgi:hypothetical protein
VSTRLSSFRLAAVFLLSLALIAYEIAVMRTFAVASWSTFGAMVISIALLGYGLAGTLLTFLEHRVSHRPDRWLAATALPLVPGMALAHVLAQRVPFSPVLITVEPRQLLWIAAYYACYALPFFLGALYLGVAFIAFRSRIHQLYFWNMFGSGLGGFLILGLMYVLPAERLIGPLLVVATVATLLTLIDYQPASGAPRLGLGSALAAGVLLLASSGLLVLGGHLRVSEFKPISYARDFPDVRTVYHSFGPTGELEVLSSSYFHFAPGLSDNASSNLTSMPADAFQGLYVDGDGPIGIMRKLRGGEEAYLDYLPMAAPYLLTERPRVLLLRLGGGIGALNALKHHARHVNVVEPDPAVLHMMRDEPFFRRYTGGLLNDPRITLVGTEPRAFAGSTRERFDVIEIGLIDSVGLSQTGGYPVAENYLYTVEGIARYLRCLSDNGVLSITVWNRLTPPRNVPKLLTTVAEALRAAGAVEPQRQVFAFDLLLSTATILVKKSPFSNAETHALLGFCRRMAFTPVYYPGMPKPAASVDRVLEDYRDQLGAPAQGTAGGAEESPPPGVEVTPEDLYHYCTSLLFSGHGRQLYDGYIFNIRPATDDRPYYTAYVKPATLPAVLRDIRSVSEEWGYVLQVATFGISIVFGLIVILLPVVGRWREVFRRQRGTLRVLLYFGALGLGYMFMEIYLIQRLVFFLAEPIFSSSVVITAMLVLSGIGSLVAGARGRRRPPHGAHLREARRAGGSPDGHRVTLAAAGIALSVVFYLFGLSPLLDALLYLPMAAKLLISIVVVAPSAFCMGIPFPTGLSGLSRHRPALIPWAWGVNGALSVTGSVLTRLISISAGFSAVLICVAALYILAALSYSGNEASRPA